AATSWSSFSRPRRVQGSSEPGRAEPLWTPFGACRECLRPPIKAVVRTAGREHLVRCQSAGPPHTKALGGPGGSHEAYVDDHRGAWCASQLQVVSITVRPAVDDSSASRLWSAPRLGWNCVALSSRVGCPRPSVVDES